MNIVLFEDKPYFPRSDERYAHIRKILKKGEGDSFSAGVVDGPSGSALITHVDEQGLAFAFTPERPIVPLFPIVLIVGFPRPIQLKRLLRDAASLGVMEIRLTGTELGEKSYRDSTLVDRGAARAALLDGCMQAGGTALPALSLHERLKDALSAVNRPDGICPPKVVLDLTPASVPLMRAELEQPTRENPLVLAIGSERGWTDPERALFAEGGFVSCSLGGRILRTETAATASLALALAKFGYI